MVNDMTTAQEQIKNVDWESELKGELKELKDNMIRTIEYSNLLDKYHGNEQAAAEAYTDYAVSDIIHGHINTLNTNKSTIKQYREHLVALLNFYEDNHGIITNNIWNDVIWNINTVDFDASQEDASSETIVLIDGSQLVFDESQGRWCIEE